MNSIRILVGTTLRLMENKQQQQPRQLQDYPQQQQQSQLQTDANDSDCPQQQKSQLETDANPIQLSPREIIDKYYIVKTNTLEQDRIDFLLSKIPRDLPPVSFKQPIEFTKDGQAYLIAKGGIGGKNNNRVFFTQGKGNTFFHSQGKQSIHPINSRRN